QAEDGIRDRNVTGIQTCALPISNLSIHAELDTSDAAYSASVEDHWKGQAYAVRAFSHLNLLMAFGQQYVDGSDLGIPYVTEVAKSGNIAEFNLRSEERRVGKECRYSR